jgi:hypothetical protein
MPQMLQAVLIAATAIAGATVFVWAAAEIVRRRNYVPLLVAIGTQLAAPYEALGDGLLHAYYPEAGQIGWLHAFGRDLPLFVQLLYLPYVVVFVDRFVHFARTRGFTTRSWWWTWTATLAATGVMEMAVKAFGPAWIYYGRQPLVIFGVPLWVNLTNTTFLFTIATGVYLIATRLPARSVWLIAPTTAAGLAAGHFVTALPMGWALDSDAGTPVVYLAVAASTAIALGVAWLAGALVFLRSSAEHLDHGRAATSRRQRTQAMRPGPRRVPPFEPNAYEET